MTTPESEDKSQLAKDLAHALYICHFRDDMMELTEDQNVRAEYRDGIYQSYLWASMLLARRVQGLKDVEIGKK